MSEQIIKDHIEVASKSSWCCLAEIIICMEKELHELKPFMNDSEIEGFTILLSIYETEKKKRLSEAYTPTDYAKMLLNEGVDGDYY